MNLTETELTLGLPGKARVSSNDGPTRVGDKRGFFETVDLNLGRSSNEERCETENDVSSPAQPPPSKAQVAGWPPVRAYRKNAMKGRWKYVKVAVDGAPYLRKVDVEMYNSYDQLLSALEDMFSSLTIRKNNLNETKIKDEGVEYVATYEDKDKDGDLMMVGDMPWEMFVESCKRLRLMKSSEAIGLAPRTPSKCSSSTDGV